MINSVFAPDRDVANSDSAMLDRELFASKCLCLGTILANLGTDENKGFVVLSGLAIKTVIGIKACVGHGNFSLFSFLMQICHKFPCPTCANTVSLVGLY